MMRCRFCDCGAPALRQRMNPPDDSSEIHHFYCDNWCAIQDQTNQPKPQKGEAKNAEN